MNEFTIQWHLTNRCNLKCSHCYIENSDFVDYPKENAILLIQDFVETIDLWSSYLPLSRSISFTGGEPLLYKNLFELVRNSKENNFFVRLLSNGTLIDKKMAKKIKENGVDAVQISIDDIGNFHDIFRGKVDSYKFALNGVRNLVDKSVYVSISSTLSRLNFKKLEKLIEVSIDNGASSIRFPRLLPLKNEKKINSELLSSADLKFAYNNILKYKKIYENKIEIITDDPLFTILDHNSFTNNNCNANSISPGGCSIGFTGICINHDGSVFPCRKLPIKIGNSLKNRFRDIWINSKILNDIRNRKNIKGRCATCYLESLCKGCRAIAYAMNNDYLGEDNQCWLTDKAR